MCIRDRIGRTPGNIVAVRPLRQGVISDYSVTEKMLKYFVHKSVGKSLFGRKPRISVCVPSGVTEVEKKAVEDATYAAGARDVKIIEEPVAAAIGAGIDIAKPCGNMIVDIGGGTSDIAVISLGGTVVSTSIKAVSYTHLGPQGGYLLTKRPDEYTVGMILRITEGSMEPVPCLEEGSEVCERMEECITIPLWRKLSEAISGVLDHTTLDDLIEWHYAKNGNDYVI